MQGSPFKNVIYTPELVYVVQFFYVPLVHSEEEILNSSWYIDLEDAMQEIEDQM